LLKITGEVRICPNVIPSKLVEYKKLDNEATLKIENSKKNKVPLPPISDEGNPKNNGIN